MNSENVPSRSFAALNVFRTTTDCPARFSENTGPMTVFYDILRPYSIRHALTILVLPFCKLEPWHRYWYSQDAAQEWYSPGTRGHHTQTLDVVPELTQNKDEQEPKKPVLWPKDILVASYELCDEGHVCMKDRIRKGLILQKGRPLDKHKHHGINKDP